jgi:hypothetical protein
LSPITKSDVQQSLPIEQHSIARPISVIKTNGHKVLPPDSTKIAKIAALKFKMKSRFKELGLTTLFSILTLAIINLLDGDMSARGSGGFLSESGAFLAALAIFVTIWFLILFIAVLTWISYQLSKIRRPGLIGLCLLILGVSSALIGGAMWSIVFIFLAALLLSLSLIFFLIALFKAIGRRRK